MQACALCYALGELMASTWLDQLFKLWNGISDVLPGNSEILKDVIKALVVAALVALITWLAKKFLRWLRRPRKDYRWRVERALSAVDQNGPGLWLAIPPERPREYDDRMNSRPYVLAIANEKGGVSKTTTIANLASAFANRLQRPVLLLDLDFQGSSGALIHAGTPWQPKPPHLSAASEAISDQITPNMLARINGFAKEFTWADHRGVTRQTPNAFGLSAFYDLKDMEDRVMVEWLLGYRLQDIRYTLYRLLRSPEVQERFALILIDCPPRLTTACIQGLCASTHLLIPTVLDPTSAKAVGYFATQLKRHEKLWPQLRVLGVLGTMTRQLQGEQDALQIAGDQLRETLIGNSSKLNWLQRLQISYEIPYDMVLRDIPEIGRAAERGVAYDCVTGTHREPIRSYFDSLAGVLEERMNM
jgi:cellulose biosynthesis protein BcsQ